MAHMNRSPHGLILRRRGTAAWDLEGAWARVTCQDRRLTASDRQSIRGQVELDDPDFERDIPQAIPAIEALSKAGFTSNYLTRAEGTPLLT